MLESAAKDCGEVVMVIWQFLVCFQARGAPREGQGDPGGQDEAKLPPFLGKPFKMLLELFRRPPRA